MDIGRISNENFHKRIGSSRSELRLSQNNFYFSSNKSETYSTLIQMLKSDLLTIQDMINSNENDIKMYQILSKKNNLTKKLSNIEENKNISNFIDKITEQSGNIEKISKIYGTQSANECIQKLFLECNLNDLFIKKVCDYFILMKLKLYNDDTYQDSLSKIISIKEFIEKIPPKVNNNNKDVNEKKNNCKNEINDFLKINTLNELLDYNLKKKKICIHVFKLVDDYFNNLNNNIIDLINKFDSDKNKLEQINNFKGTQIQKYNKLNDIYNLILDDKNNKYEELLNKEKNTPNIEEEINKINEKYEKEINELNNKLDNIIKENEDLKNKINSNSEFKYTEKDIDDLKKNSLNEKNKIEESYKKQIESLNDDIKKINEKINECENNIKIKELEKKNKEEEKEKELNKKEENIIPSKIEKIDIMEFVKKHDLEYSKNKKEANKKFDNQLKELNLKVNQLTEEINIIKLEKLDLKKKLDIIQAKNFNPNSYEKILLEQFDMVRDSFSQKVDDLNYQLEMIQNDSRRKIYELEQKLKESEHLKQVFLEQILSLQNKLGI